MIQFNYIRIRYRFLTLATASFRIVLAHDGIFFHWRLIQLHCHQHHFLMFLPLTPFSFTGFCFLTLASASLIIVLAIGSNIFHWRPSPFITLAPDSFIVALALDTNFLQWTPMKFYLLAPVSLHFGLAFVLFFFSLPSDSVYYIGTSFISYFSGH